jgi:hypothetical protein
MEVGFARLQRHPFELGSRWLQEHCVSDRVWVLVRTCCSEDGVPMDVPDYLGLKSVATVAKMSSHMFAYCLSTGIRQ